MTVIEKCPHCEGLGTIWSDNGCDTVYAVCLSCGCRTKEFKTTEEAAEAWNKRVVKLVSVSKIISGLRNEPEARMQHKPYAGPMFKSEGKYTDFTMLKCKLLTMNWDAKDKKEKSTIEKVIEMVEKLPTITISGGEVQ